MNRVWVGMKAETREWINQVIVRVNVVDLIISKCLI